MGGSKQIQIKLHPDGTITGETIGMKGTSCLSALELLQALIDATIVDSAFTPEFYEVDETVQQNVVQGNESYEVHSLGD